jgi:hypothetical protein
LQEYGVRIAARRRERRVRVHILARVVRVGGAGLGAVSAPRRVAIAVSVTGAGAVPAGLLRVVVAVRVFGTVAGQQVARVGEWIGEIRWLQRRQYG